MQPRSKLILSTVLLLAVCSIGSTWIASPGKGSHGGTGATAAFRSMSSTSWGSRTDLTVTAPAGIVNGDILILYLAIGLATPPTPTLPSGFTLIAGPTTVTNSGFSVVVRVAYKVASGESGDYAILHSSASSQGLMFCISGASGSAPVSSINSGTGQTTTATGITTPSNNSVVLFAANAWQVYNGVSSPPSGTTPTFTERYDDGGVTSVIYAATGVLATAGATGSKTQTNTNNVGEPWIATLVAVGP